MQPLIRLPDTYICPAETGYYYLQSRYYDPYTSRFINADEPELISTLSQGSLKGGNLFAYCEGNPVNYTDPTGHARINIKWIWWAIDGFIWVVPVLFTVAKIWKSTVRSAAKLYNFGLKLIQYGKKIFKKIDNRLYCAFARDSSYRIVKTIGALVGFVTIFHSIGCMIQYVVDILDGKWDGYLNTNNIHPRFDLTRDY